MAEWKAGRCLLKDLRLAKGWTQDDLCERTGVSRSTISAIENKKYIIADLTMAKALAHPFGVHIDDLYEWILIK